MLCGLTIAIIRESYHLANYGWAVPYLFGLIVLLVISAIVAFVRAGRGNKLKGDIPPPPISAEELTSGIRFISPRSVLICHSRHELQMKMPVMNLLPFDVELTHIEFDISRDKANKIIFIDYSRSKTLKAQDETSIELPIKQLSDKQLEILGSDHILWFFGDADVKASGTTATVSIAELSCVPTKLL